MATTNEATPLIRRSSADSLPNSVSARSGSDSQSPSPSWLSRALGVENLILFAGFLITLSFSFTQVPNSDSLSGTLNLFVTGWMVKKFGPRSSLIAQTVIPAIRVATQILGVVAGKSTGMIIIQATQAITVIGGPAGYILVINIIAGEVVEPKRRTAVFGQLQGCIMLGQGIGFLIGGMIGDAIDIRAPFDVAFVFFLVASVYVRFALPYIPPDSLSDAKKADREGGIAGFLAPLRILVPQRLRLASGAVRRHYGVIFLCSGIFVGVLATGYAPFLIQIYATAAFEFDQAANGWLMAEFALMRSIFLIFMFPPIINWGRRRWTPATRDAKGDATAPAAIAISTTEEERGGEEQRLVCPSDDDDRTIIPTSPGDFDAAPGEQTDMEPVKAPALGTKETYLFDLVLLRWSLVVDGALTTVAAFATKSWHIYFAAFLLPLGSGSAPAAKGVITEMCPESQRADALNAVTLIENVARLATQGFFGFVFASLAEAGKAYVTFYINAAVAVIATGILLFSHFPPEGSRLLEDDELDHHVYEQAPLSQDSTAAPNTPREPDQEEDHQQQ
ncbi:Major Facilitator Superfamily [Geosmithia morbida]|uniref:Major Facilitator Superfamily n=1 Tax=Geosmithia morbida TaxID=1094350 RepID=A0A9P4YQX7_9HYPO|nr:Major Facilitator Superfamily [Geosmithia morbida]KAF4119981.1 Major Facilitator Superfamily [Geosmithia morbida]